MKVINTLTEFYKYTNAGKPKHALIDVEKSENFPNDFLSKSPAIQINLYKISLKKNFKGILNYGKTKYDTDTGIIIFSEPGQVVSWNSIEKWNGYNIIFDPKLLSNHFLSSKIKTYYFFSYSVNKALYLTDSEEAKINSLCSDIYDELLLPDNESSQNIILSLLSVILQYSERFYKRQFKTRQILYNDYIEKFKQHLFRYTDNINNTNKEQKPANVKYFAEKMNISPGYLTDLIKSYTGVTTTEYIHGYLINKAETLLKNTEYTVSEISYNLGFENLPYFSRLFKKKNGQTPSQYRKS